MRGVLQPRVAELIEMKTACRSPNVHPSPAASVRAERAMRPSPISGRPLPPAWRSGPTGACRSPSRRIKWKWPSDARPADTQREGGCEVLCLRRLGMVRQRGSHMILVQAGSHGDPVGSRSQGNRQRHIAEPNPLQRPDRRGVRGTRWKMTRATSPCCLFF